MLMKASSGNASPIFEAASDDSSSLNRKLMSLNTEAWKEKWRTGQDIEPDLLTGMPFCAAKRVMTVPAAEMTREERRELRKVLREDLNRVQDLSSKLEARELQLRRQSQSTGIYPTLSDAQFSGSDVRSAGGKEVTSQLALVAPGLNQRNVELSNQRPITANDDTAIGVELSHNKRTPKANQLYNNSEFVVGKDKMSPPVKSRPKQSTGSKRGATRMDGGDRKRKPFGMSNKQNLDFMSQCRNVLKKLMGHKDGWVFNQPVDAKELGLSDYHFIIKKPMDLGTIKAKLDRKEYSSPQEFADDVRLTFNNAMTYNPRGNDVHEMAVELQNLFEENWKVISEKLEKTDYEGELEVLNQPVTQLPENPHVFLETTGFNDQPQPTTNKKKAPANKKSTVNKPKAPAKPKTPAKPKPLTKPKAASKPKVPNKPKREMSYQEKAKLSKSLQLLPLQDDIIRLIKERNPNMNQQDDEIEVDIDTFDNETLWELDLFVKKSQDKNKKALERETQSMANNVALNSNKKHQGELREGDIDIVDDVPKSSFPAVVVDKNTGYGSRSSTSGSSSSESGSSSDSESGSSSASDSDDADDNLSADKRR